MPGVVSVAVLGSPSILSHWLNCRWVSCKLDSNSRCTGLVVGGKGKKCSKHVLQFKQTLSMRKQWKFQGSFRGKIQKKITEFYRKSVLQNPVKTEIFISTVAPEPGEWHDHCMYRAQHFHCYLEITNLSCFYTVKKQNRDERTIPVQDVGWQLCRSALQL